MSISSLTASQTGASRPDPAEFLQKMFERIDRDGDGKVTEQEFTTDMEKRFGSDASASGRPDAAEIFKQADGDSDGAIDVSEFKEAMKSMRQQSAATQGGQPPAGGPPPGGGSGAAKAEEVFDEMDTDKDGKVSLEELLAALEKKQEDGATGGSSAAVDKFATEVKELFQSADADGDGSITQTELASLFEQLRPPHDQERSGYAADGTPAYATEIGANLSTVA